MDEKAARTLRNAVVLVLSDGKLDEQEKHFIEALRRKLDVDAERFRRLCADVRANPHKMSLPSDPRQAEEMIDLLVAAAAANQNIADVQRRVIRRLAARAGVQAAALDRMFAAHGAQHRTDQAAVNQRLQDIYDHFTQWDEVTRRSKLAALKDLGPDAVPALLRIIESYRLPAGAQNALELKRMAIEQIGCLGDGRAAYYLVQHISLTEQQDEAESQSLRQQAAEALGRIVGESFPPTPAGVAAARQWWYSEAARRYDRLIH